MKSLNIPFKNVDIESLDHFRLLYFTFNLVDSFPQTMPVLAKQAASRFPGLPTIRCWSSWHRHCLLSTWWAVMGARSQSEKEREDGISDMLISLWVFLPFPFLCLAEKGIGKKKEPVSALAPRPCLHGTSIACEKQMLFALVSLLPSWVSRIMREREGSNRNALGDNKQPKIKRMGI